MQQVKIVKQIEIEAKETCAFCNWSRNCEDCSHRIWPQGKWCKKERFDWRTCNDWQYYLPRLSKLKLRILGRI